jgi:hypothetical protein
MPSNRTVPRPYGGQLVEMQIRGPRPGIETTLQAEVDRIRPILNRRANADAIPGRRKQLRPATESR